MRARIVRHQKRRAKGTRDRHPIALLQVAKVVRTEASPFALDGERDRIGVGLFAVARTGDRVETQPMRLAVLIGARRGYANALAFQNRERRLAEVQDDVLDVIVRGRIGEAVRPDHCRDGGAGAAEEVDARLRRRRRRDALAADAGMGARDDLVDLVLERFYRAFAAGLRDRFLRRQLAPGELLIERIGFGDDPPIVDRAGWAGRDAIHAVIALLGVDHVVGAIVSDRADRARLLAGVAADAHLRVDHVLFDECLVDFHERSERARSSAVIAGLVPATHAALRPYL